MAASTSQVIASTSFVCQVGDEQVVIHAGDVLPATHPAVKGRAELFEKAAK